MVVVEGAGHNNLDAFNLIDKIAAFLGEQFPR